MGFDGREPRVARLGARGGVSTASRPVEAGGSTHCEIEDDHGAVARVDSDRLAPSVASPLVRERCIPPESAEDARLVERPLASDREGGATGGRGRARFDPRSVPEEALGEGRHVHATRGIRAVGEREGLAPAGFARQLELAHARTPVELALGAAKGFGVLAPVVARRGPLPEVERARRRAIHGVDQDRVARHAERGAEAGRPVRDLADHADVAAVR